MVGQGIFLNAARCRPKEHTVVESGLEITDYDDPDLTDDLHEHFSARGIDLTLRYSPPPPSRLSAGSSRNHPPLDSSRSSALRSAGPSTGHAPFPSSQSINGVSPDTENARGRTDIERDDIKERPSKRLRVTLPTAPALGPDVGQLYLRWHDTYRDITRRCGSLFAAAKP